MSERDSGGQGPSNPLPPPKPPKLRTRHRYHPGDHVEGRDYVVWWSAWNGRAKYPPADRSNRLEPWGRDPETNLVIAPHGISPVSGCPRLTPPTHGSMRNQHLKKSPEPAGYMSEYTGALVRQMSETLERRVSALLGRQFLGVERTAAWKAMAAYVYVECLGDDVP